jgi:hypothetical protein
MTAPPQISGGIPRFSLKGSHQSPPLERGGGGVCGVSPQVWLVYNKKKHCPHQPAFMFFLGEKSTLPQRSDGEISPFSQVEFIKVRGVGACRPKSVFRGTVLMMVYKSVAR